MKSTLTVMSACAVLLFGSCTTITRTASTVKVDPSVSQYPTVTDLKVDTPKVSLTETWQFVPFNFGQPSLKVRKKNMMAQMVKDKDADVLVEPQISYTKKMFGPRSLTITGYPATFKNFRPASEKDLKAFAIMNPACKGHSVAREKSDTTSKVAVVKTVRAKTPSRFGVVLGLNSSTTGSSSTDSKTGFHVGVRGELNFRKPVYLTASLLYSRKGHKRENYDYYSGGYGEVKANAGYVEIPIMVGYRWNVGNSMKIFGETGPYFAAGVGGNIKYPDGYEEHTFHSGWDNRGDIGWALGAGVEYDKYSFRLGYEFGLKEIGGHSLPENRNFMAGFAYMF